MIPPILADTTMARSGMWSHAEAEILPQPEYRQWIALKPDRRADEFPPESRLQPLIPASRWPQSISTVFARRHPERADDADRRAAATREAAAITGVRSSTRTGPAPAPRP